MEATERCISDWVCTNGQYCRAGCESGVHVLLRSSFPCQYLILECLFGNLHVGGGDPEVQYFVLSVNVLFDILVSSKNTLLE